MKIIFCIIGAYIGFIVGDWSNAEDQEENLVGQAELGVEVSLMGDNALKSELVIP